MNHIIQYRSFGTPDVLEEADVPLTEPQGADVRVKVRAVGLNPVDFKTCGDWPIHGAGPPCSPAASAAISRA